MKIFRVECDVAPGQEGALDRLLADRIKGFWLSQPGVKGFHIHRGWLPEELFLSDLASALYQETLGKQRRTLLIEVDDLASLQRVLDSPERRQLREELLSYTVDLKDEIPLEDKGLTLLDERAKKTALRMIAHGLYILGTKWEGELNAGTITWLSQCSFKPPLVMLGIKGASSLHEPLEESGSFAISFLRHDQAEIARSLFRSARVEDERINGIPYHTARTGAPIISEAPAWIECRLVHAYEGGDHTVVVGEVISAGASEDDAQLLLLRDMGLHYGG